MGVKTVYMFNPDMLIIVRETRGLSADDLACEVCITTDTQAGIEAGASIPSHWLVSRYSDILRCPMPLFYRSNKTGGEE